ncbi:hypothetical protein NI389_15630 [Pseudoalteromonas xiamenensis]|uniref:hypothetical protein n=1 Tax=Pseudoalteromonas xiamenensis TaxID=882626 RepID=UPI0027E532DA|nr:hypothetical protein [Pseudoalteromonas xiamenensis]WMN59588.1 hypothetical protein NI389_15630 [Pseudoalteromonas xiamenensis]
MSFALYISAVLLLVIAFVHSFLGERYILTRLFKRDLPKLFGSDDFTKRTLRFAWHITSIAWLGFAAILALLATPGTEKASLIYVIAATFIVHGLVALLGSRGKHVSWVVFLAISVSALVSLS